MYLVDRHEGTRVRFVTATLNIRVADPGPMAIFRNGASIIGHGHAGKLLLLRVRRFTGTTPRVTRTDTVKLSTKVSTFP